MLDPRRERRAAGERRRARRASSTLAGPSLVSVGLLAPTSASAATGLDNARAWIVVQALLILIAFGAIVVLVLARRRQRTTEASLRLDESRLEALLTLGQMTDSSTEELTEFALEEGVRLTGSEFGYFAFTRDDETVLEMHAWSGTARQRCAVPDAPRRFLVAETGLWGEAVRQRRPVVTNDYLAHDVPGKTGLPVGHVPLRRHLVVPIFDGERIVVVVGVGNKSAPFDSSDVRQLELLMNGMWKILRRHEEERAVRESDEAYRAVFNATTDAIYVHDFETLAVLDVNEAACRMFGIGPEEMKASAPGQFMTLRPPFTLEQLVRHVDACRQGRPQLFEWEGKDLQGRALPLEISLRRASINGVDRLLAVVRDISERKRSAEEQRRNEVQLQHAQRLECLGVMAGGIAHDFNNLLTVVIGNADLGLQCLPASEEAAELRPLFESIRIAGLRAAGLTQQMLTYSGQGRQEFEPIEFNALLGELSQLLQVSISKKAEILSRLDDPSPWILGDPTSIRQVALNLIVNAAEALGDQPGRVTVSTSRVHAERAMLQALILGSELPEGDYAQLQITDTGCGMDEATLARIFDPFFSTKFTGRGLGLPAVLGIVRRHRGAIGITSAAGEGSTVTVLLRLADAPTRIQQPVQERALRRPPAGKLVLVVDDEEGVRLLVQALLEQAGFEVLTAGDGQEALQLFRERGAQVALVVLDLTMPRMDGAETLQELRRLSPALPVLIATGHAEAELSLRLQGQGASGFLQKPFDAERLVQSVRQALGAPISILAPFAGPRA